MTKGWHLNLMQRGVGDTVVATRLVRDLKAAYPDKRLSIDGTLAREVFAGNPHVEWDVESELERVDVNYKYLIDRAWTGEHLLYVDAGHVGFEEATGLSVPRGSPFPQFTTDLLEQTKHAAGTYWVMMAGTKLDMPVKQWPPRFFAEVVNYTSDISWVQAGRLKDERMTHRQWDVPGTTNLVGMTEGFDQLLGLIRYSAGVLCHMSLGFLLAAAFRKPCIVLAGGREPHWMHEYPKDEWSTYHVFHSIGKYDCCWSTGCARRIAGPAHTETPYPPGWLCELPVVDPHVSHVAQCLSDISPATVARKVLEYHYA